MVTRSKNITKLKNTKQSHSRQHKRRDDTEPDYRGCTLREGKIKFFSLRDKNGTSCGSLGQNFLVGQAFPELPSCFIASPQLLWACITLLLCLLGFYKTFTQFCKGRHLMEKDLHSSLFFNTNTRTPWKSPEISPTPQISSQQEIINPGKRVPTIWAFLPRVCPRQPALCSVVQLWEGFYFFSLSHVSIQHSFPH